MDGTVADDRYTQERRRRLAAERTLERTRTELSRAYRALVANADRLSLRYLSEREANLRLTDRQRAILTQRKEAAEKADRARRRLWHALETMRDGFALFDADARLVAANSVYLGLFDVASEIGPGASAEELFRVAAEEGAFEVDADPDDWVADQLARWEVDDIGPQVLRTYDGRTIRFQDRRAPDGDLVSLAIDITEEQAREDSLAAARDAAEETARAKQAFLSRMSHELRTPVNGILGLSEMLAERELDADAQTYARTIRDSAESLLTIVGDTLDVSQLEAGRLELCEETFDLEGMLVDCVRLAAGTLPDDRVQIALDYPLAAPVRVAGDEGRLRQIVTKLLGNAVKVTDTGHVLVRVVLTPDEGGARMTLDVMDTGPGIPAGQRDTVFEAFAQVEDGRPQAEGTGLGLTIARGLAERMGGTLTIAEPEGDAGTCMRLSLPLRQAQSWPDRPVLPRVSVPRGTGVQGDVLATRLRAAGGEVVRGGPAEVVVLPVSPGMTLDPPEGVPVIALGRAADVPDWGQTTPLDLPVTGAALIAALRSAAPETRAATATRILIVDDNATNRFLVERMLRRPDCVLDLADDGATAVAAYRAQRPDVVLMDLSMPGMDGFEALAEIQALEAARDGSAAPVIALTAHTADGIAERVTEAGFTALHTKPVRKGELEAAIADALSGI